MNNLLISLIFRPLTLGGVIGSCVLLTQCAPINETKVTQVEVPPGRGVAKDSPYRLQNASAAELEIIQKINAKRRSLGLANVSEHAYLTQLAREHSEYMRRTAEKSNNLTLISHDGFDVRFEKATDEGGFSALSENVGMVQGVAGKYVTNILRDGWVKSPGHYKNLSDPKHKFTGVGVSIGKDNTVYATQLFSR